MKRLFALFLWICLMSPATAADPADGVQARAFLEPDGDIYVGQLVRLNVEVSTNTWFTTAPRYPEIRLNGAIVLSPEAFGTNFTIQEGGQTRSGQRRRYAVFPQRAGALEIPEITVTLGVSIDGKASKPFTVFTRTITVNAVMPPAARDIGHLVTTPRLTVSESYDGNLQNLKVGDAVTRTVTIAADETLGLVLPPIEFPRINGLAIYPAEPRLSDKVDRGRYRGQRIDSATYVLQRPGDFTLPEIVVRWWNPERKRLETKTLATQVITVAPNPNHPTPAVPAKTKEPIGERFKRFASSGLEWISANIAWLTLVFGAGILMVLAGRRYGARAKDWLAEQLQRARQSERRYFRDFQRACRSGDDGRIAASFWRWLDRVAPRTTAGRLLGSVSDPDILELIEGFKRKRYGKEAVDGSAGPKPRTKDISRLRRAVLRQVHRKRESPSGERRLNPVGWQNQFDSS